MTEQIYAPVRDSTTLAGQTALTAPESAPQKDERQTNQSPPLYDPDNPEEVWKPVAGFENRFEISCFGKIRSLPRPCIGAFGARRLPGKILKTIVGKDGYERLITSMIVRSRRKTIQIRVHRGVATAFRPNPNNWPIVHHKDANKLNNRADNLEWTTQKQNVRYAIESDPARMEALRKLHTYSVRANQAKRNLLTSQPTLKNE